MKAALHVLIGLAAVLLGGYGFLTAAAGGMSDNPDTAASWTASGFAMFFVGFVVLVLDVFAWWGMRPQKPGSRWP